jgi:hypothetical protein
MYIKYLFEQLLFSIYLKFIPLRDKDMSNNSMFFNELRRFDE